LLPPFAGGEVGFEGGLVVGALVGVGGLVEVPEEEEEEEEV